MGRLRAGAALALTGRYAAFGRMAADGLWAWAKENDVHLVVEDSGDDDAAAGRLTEALADGCDILFGAYGSGPMRAVAAAFVDRPEVVWNHGGAEVPRVGARVVDVLGPAECYWSDLSSALVRLGLPPGEVAVLRGEGAFAHAVADGAERALQAAGHAPVRTAAFDARSAADVVEEAMRRGARVLVSGARFPDDLALARAARDKNVAIGMIACGVADLHVELGRDIVGWFGPSQWIETPRTPAPASLSPPVAYPAAQAYAAGILACEAIRRAGSTNPDAVWDAARAMTTLTFFGAYAVDAEGRQIAHRPTIVRWVMTADGPQRRPA